MAPKSLDISPLRNSAASRFVTAQFRTRPKRPRSAISLYGQTAIITGASGGLGLESARQFLEFDLSHLIITVRSTEKGEVAANLLRKTYPKSKIEVWSLDMLSYESIQAFAGQCATLSRLDFVILNAGCWEMDFNINQSTGHEVTFQVNYLSTALLAILLLPVLKSKSPAGTPGRLCIVGSGLALEATFKNRGAVPLIPSFDDGKDWNMTSNMPRYSTTKTLLLMFELKLSEYVRADDVVVNIVDPAMTGGSGLLRHNKPLMRAAMAPMIWLTARSLEAGAWTYFDAAVVKGKETHCSFLMNLQIYPYHEMMYTEAGMKTTERLWEETLDELDFAGVRQILDSMALEGPMDLDVTI